MQLDHVDDAEASADALAAGAGALMADGSRLPLSGTVDLVRSLAELARHVGAGIEVELGHIEGDEDVAAAVAAGALTDPDEATTLVAATRADCLAVSIGNVHGTYARPPSLDWPRLEAIATALPELPLSLHGASGLPDQDVRRAIASGVCKVNVNTELRARYLAELEAALPAAREGLRVLELTERVVEGVAATVGEKLELFGWSHTNL